MDVPIYVVVDRGVEEPTDAVSSTTSDTRIFFAGRGAPSLRSSSWRSTSSRRCFNWFSRRCDSSNRFMRLCSDSRRISSPRRAFPSSCSSWDTRPRKSSLMTSSSLTRVLSAAFEAMSCSYVCGTSSPDVPFSGEAERPGDGCRICSGGSEGEPLL